MTNAQIEEMNRCRPLLEECREHLDTVMYRLGDIDDPSYLTLRSVYSLVCKAMDTLPNY